MGRDFNGSSDEIIVSDDAALDVANVTVMAWFNADAWAVNDFILAKSSSTTDDAYGIAISAEATDDIKAIIGTDGGSERIMNADDGGAGRPLGSWHLLTMTYTSASWKLWFDGVEQKEVTTFTGDLDQTAADMHIGDLRSLAAHFDGILAEISIWDGVLSDEVMLALSRGVSPFAIRSKTLVYYCPLWGNESPEVDWSGNGNTGTLDGTTKDVHVPVELVENYL